MHSRLGGFARYRHRLVTGCCDLVVRGDRELQDHVGAPVSHSPEVPGMVARGFRRAEPDVDRNPCLAQPRMAAPGHLRTGILDRADDTGNAARDNGIRAGWRLAE